MVERNGSTVEQETRAEDAAPRHEGTPGAMAYLRRIGIYLWIGLTNPGPPARRASAQGPRA